MLSGTLSHYRIKESLGTGGMGEVYRVEDTRLGRDVALKVLKLELAEDRERLRRFRREAQLLAALDHPGIVTIFSIEEDGGVNFLTMQLIEGETLTHFIADAGMDIGLFYEIAIPLTEAVAATHERRVIHRDLKPSNVMRTSGHLEGRSASSRSPRLQRGRCPRVLPRERRHDVDPPSGSPSLHSYRSTPAERFCQPRQYDLRRAHEPVTFPPSALLLRMRSFSNDQ